MSPTTGALWIGTDGPGALMAPAGGGRGRLQPLFKTNAWVTHITGAMIDGEEIVAAISENRLTLWRADLGSLVLQIPGLQTVAIHSPTKSVILTTRAGIQSMDISDLHPRGARRQLPSERRANPSSRR